MERFRTVFDTIRNALHSLKIYIRVLYINVNTPVGERCDIQSDAIPKDAICIMYAATVPCTMSTGSRLDARCIFAVVFIGQLPRIL